MSAQVTTPPIGLASLTHAFQASSASAHLAWLEPVRQKSALQWQTEGFPTKKSEHWRYLNLAALENARLVPMPPPARSERDRFSSLNTPIEIAFLNGRFMKAWSRLPKTDGLALSVLSECSKTDDLEAFREHLTSAASKTVFAMMNTSFFQDAVVISLAPGVVLEDPIAIYHLTDSAATGDTAFSSPRVFARLGRGSQAAIVECFNAAAGNSNAYVTNAVCDLRLAQGAHLSHARVQLEGENAMHFGATTIHQERDSFCETYQFSLGGALARHDLHILLDGEGAEAVLDGLYMTDRRQCADNHTSVEHLKPQTTSSQLYKGILAGESRAVFNGHVSIHKDAQKSNASQLNNNLILNPKAEIDTRPELAIDADDVKASHGATIGRIDREQVFYLQTRAISRADAERILARGFAFDIVDRVRRPRLRDALTALLGKRIGGLDV